MTNPNLLPSGVTDLVQCPERLGPRRPVIGREREIRRVVLCLAGEREAFGDDYPQPVLIGPRGSGKTAVIREAICRLVEHPTLSRERRFFVTDPDWLARVAFDEFEQLLDALNGLPENPVLYVTDMPGLSERFYPNQPDQAFHLLTKRLQLRRRLFFVTEMQEHESEGRIHGWVRDRYERIVLAELPKGADPETDPAYQIVLTHSDPNDSLAAGPYVPTGLATALVSAAREWLPFGTRPGVLVELLAAVRARADGRRETTADDLRTELVARTRLPNWQMLPGLAPQSGDFLTELETARTAVLAATDNSEAVCRFVEAVTKHVKHEGSGLTQKPVVFLLAGPLPAGLVANVAEHFYGTGSLVELPLGDLPRSGFTHFRRWAEDALAVRVRRVLLLRDSEDAPAGYMTSLESHVTRVQDTFRSGRAEEQQSCVLRRSLILLTTASEETAVTVRAALRRIVFTNVTFPRPDLSAPVARPAEQPPV